MTAGVTSDRIVRWVATFAMTLALVAALLPAFGQGVSAQEDGSGDGAAESGPITVQTWTCPVEYGGSDFLTDCAPGAVSHDVVLTFPDATTLSASTDGNGLVTFAGGNAGSYQLALQVPGDFAGFYSACFDGNDVFGFDGSSNVIGFDLTAGASLFCRWYVIPADAGGETPSPAPSAGTASSAAAVQVYLCPTEYTGDDYLTDCAPTDTQIPVSINPGSVYDGATAVSAPTEAEGFVTFEGLTPGEYTLALGVPGDFVRFYYACFDVTFGSEVFVKSGDTNTIAFVIEQGGDLSCRWYVTPEDARGETPSVAPSAEPSPAASRSPGAVTGLPSTGIGSGASSGGDSTFASFALVALGVLALAAAAIVTRRRDASR